MAVDLLSLTEVLARTGLSRPTFYRMRQRGDFPEAVRLAANKHVVLWRSDDVERWCEWNAAPRVQRGP